MHPRFSFKDKLLVLRLTRLGQLPPAYYSSQILAESGLPVLVLEFGFAKETRHFLNSSPLRRRWGVPWVELFPRALRSTTIFFAVMVRLLFSIVWEGKPKLVVGHGGQESLLAYILKKVFGIPYVIHVHEVFDKGEVKGPLNEYLFKKEGPILRNASFLIFPEEERIRIYQNRYGFQCPTYLVPNCPRLIESPRKRNLRWELGLPEDSILMGYLGGMGPHNMIVEAVRTLSKFPKLYFLLWGWGDESYLRQIKQAAQENGVADRVLFLGQVGLEDKYENLAGCNFSYCFYRPSLLRLKHPTTASNKLFESMACGVPVIAPPTFSQFLKANPCGVAAPTADEAGIGKAIHELISNQGSLYHLGVLGRFAFETRYYYEKQFLSTLEAYRSAYQGEAIAA